VCVCSHSELQHIKEGSLMCATVSLHSACRNDRKAQTIEGKRRAVFTQKARGHFLEEMTSCVCVCVCVLVLCPTIKNLF